MIVFDIETAPSDNAADFLEEPTHPGSMKKLETIEKWRQEELPALKAAQLERAALSPVTGKVLVIGVIHHNKLLTWEECSEDLILRGFWSYFSHASNEDWVGFNCHSFDWPFLIRRSWVHGIKPTIHMERDRYFPHNCIDLMQKWQLGNREDRISLDKASRLLGLGAKTGSGGDFAKLYATDRDAAIEYLRNDLELTRKLAERMGL